MDNQIKEILTGTVKELLLKIDMEGRVEVDETSAESIEIKIDSEEAGLLIGQGGENMAALQHLARLIANKKIDSGPINFTLDINSYRANRLGLLKGMVLEIAKQVSEEKKFRILEPMSAYERRVVHLALKGFEGITTESQGEGLDRRIIIKPQT